MFCSVIETLSTFYALSLFVFSFLTAMYVYIYTHTFPSDDCTIQHEILNSSSCTLRFSYLRSISLSLSLSLSRYIYIYIERERFLAVHMYVPASLSTGFHKQISCESPISKGYTDCSLQKGESPPPMNVLYLNPSTVSKNWIIGII